jgi:hypothetical protein
MAQVCNIQPSYFDTYHHISHHHAKLYQLTEVWDILDRNMATDAKRGLGDTKRKQLLFQEHSGNAYTMVEKREISLFRMKTAKRSNRGDYDDVYWNGITTYGLQKTILYTKNADQPKGHK